MTKYEYGQLYKIFRIKVKSSENISKDIHDIVFRLTVVKKLPSDIKANVWGGP